MEYPIMNMESKVTQHESRNIHHAKIFLSSSVDEFKSKTKYQPILQCMNVVKVKLLTPIRSDKYE